MCSTFIFIDDSGLITNKENEKYIAKDSMLWGALLCDTTTKIKLEKEIQLLLENYNISEFHFKYIYGGTKDYKNYTVEQRLEIFKKFVELYNKYTPMILTCVIGDRTLINSGFPKEIENVKIDGFKFNKPKDVSLFILLLSCRDYVLKEKLGICKIIIDEGRQKVNSNQVIKQLNNITLNNEVEYKSSEKVVLLQFIDFIVYSMNRIQTNVDKKKNSYFDKQFMKIISEVQWNSDVDMVHVENIDEIQVEFAIRREELSKEHKKSKAVIDELLSDKIKYALSVEKAKKSYKTN